MTLGTRQATGNGEKGPTITITPLNAVITRITQKSTRMPLTRYAVVHLLMIHCYQQNKLLGRPDFRLVSLSLLPTPVITKSACMQITGPMNRTGWCKMPAFSKLLVILLATTWELRQQNHVNCLVLIMMMTPVGGKMQGTSNMLWTLYLV